MTWDFEDHMPSHARLAHGRLQIRVMRGVKALAAFVLALSSFVAAAKGCDRREVGPFEKARQRVQRLEEFKAWRASHSFPVAFSLGKSTTIRVGSTCYWQVPVYADRPERFELWHIFYVSEHRKAILVLDIASDEPETLEAWRKQERAR
jgi:hypothetical protein